MFMLFATLSQAWNVIGGFAGQVSFGHATFFGIGAYAALVLLKRFDLSPWVGMLIGGGCAAIVAVLIGYPGISPEGALFRDLHVCRGRDCRAALRQLGFRGRGHRPSRPRPAGGPGQFHVVQDQNALFLYRFRPLCGRSPPGLQDQPFASRAFTCARSSRATKPPKAWGSTPRNIKWSPW